MSAIALQYQLSLTTYCSLLTLTAYDWVTIEMIKPSLEPTQKIVHIAEIWCLVHQVSVLCFCGISISLSLVAIVLLQCSSVVESVRGPACVVDVDGDRRCDGGDSCGIDEDAKSSIRNSFSISLVNLRYVAIC